ncbi:hypothetical protein PCANC_22157 [Puccinia coronata f. sp. avenae]|uniref:Uncharacterized protein n=1 Tax=Puccinia coronata f. sp. avenae TaxID=200324 RepID=A0A2N5SIE1_9BASI|nr:hypothetical protein PCANC_22157 [Puccinia coronata f. sp. avenae]
METPAHDEASPDSCPSPSNRRVAPPLRFRRLPQIHMSSSPAYRRMEPYIKPPPLLPKEAEILSSEVSCEAAASPRGQPSEDIEVLADQCRLYLDSPTIQDEMKDVILHDFYLSDPSDPPLDITRKRILNSEAEASRYFKAASRRQAFVFTSAPQQSNGAPKSEKSTKSLKRCNPFRINVSDDAPGKRFLASTRLIMIQNWRIQVHVQDTCFRANRTLRNNWVFELAD